MLLVLALRACTKAPRNGAPSGPVTVPVTVAASAAEIVATRSPVIARQASDLMAISSHSRFGSIDVCHRRTLPSRLQRLGRHRPLPPCGGGTGRGVATCTEFAITPSPHGGREQTESAAPLLLRLTCANANASPHRC